MKLISQLTFYIKPNLSYNHVCFSSGYPMTDHAYTEIIHITVFYLHNPRFNIGEAERPNATNFSIFKPILEVLILCICSYIRADTYAVSCPQMRIHFVVAN